MKLKKFLKHYSEDKFLCLYLLSNSEEEVCLSSDKIIYAGYAENVPFYLTNYKVKLLLPDLRRFNGDEKCRMSCAEGMINVFVYEKRGEEDCT